MAQLFVVSFAVREGEGRREGREEKGEVGGEENKSKSTQKSSERKGQGGVVGKERGVGLEAIFNSETA